jgi:3-hydroxyisobutyrate dehydrogenase
MRIAFVGLGLMGSRMAANLLAKGFAVTAWNRTRSKAEALAQKGATVAGSPRAAAEGAHVICTNVADPKAMAQVVEGPEGLRGALRPGLRWVDFSTLSPAITRGLGEVCEAVGAEFLEAPVTGSKAGAESGTLVLMCGGRRETFDALSPVLAAVGRKAVYCGPLGAASHVKLIGNSMIAHMMQALGEGAALARRAGVPLETVLEVVQSSGYASPYWTFKGEALKARDATTHFSIDLMHKDLTLALATGSELEVPMPGTAAIREVYQLARQRGLGERDIVATAAIMDPGLFD